MTLKQAYSYSVQFLERNNVDEADFKALCAACHIAGIKNSEYLAHTEDFVNDSKLAGMLWRLKNGEPLQYIIGKWDFYNSEFFVGEGVLIPRPETEELVERAVFDIKQLGQCVVYDLCSGSGCIGISVAKACPNAQVYLVEKSKDAYFYLEKNAKGIDNAHIINGDICQIIDLPKADVIISNPPYIRSSEISSLQSEVRQEPLMALDGGVDGLDFYRIINDKWSCAFNKKGILYLEIGEDQGDSVISILSNYTNIEVYKDLYGNDRIIRAVNKGD